jgi:primosomal protein N' (replication factor Y) (superfamily II helicase)
LVIVTPVFADIALPVPIDHAFTYSVPAELAQQAKIGSRVLVPFGKKSLSGVIVGRPSSSSVANVKPIRDVLDSVPTFSEDMLRFTRWIAEYYLAPWGEVLRAATPQGLSVESRSAVSLLAPDIQSALSSLKSSAANQRAVLEALAGEHAMSIRRLQKKTGIRSLHAVLHQLEARGYIGVHEESTRPKAAPKTESMVKVSRIGNEYLEGNVQGDEGESLRLTQKQETILRQVSETFSHREDILPIATVVRNTDISVSMIKTLIRKGVLEGSEREVIRKSGYDDVAPPTVFTLNQYQSAALAAIEQSLNAGKYATCLLLGITGSGKTQVYIEAIRKVLAMGKTAIVLVPEIALTPQTVRRFKAHFGDDVAVMHSQLSTGERYDAWRMAHQGKVRIVIGPRSAIFAPLKNVGLIVVDEEHDASYKQFDASPRYHGRDAAIVRASQANAVVVLGSATPSSESYFNAINGKYRLIELPTRIDDARLPVIEIVDMTKERKRLYEETKAEVAKSKKEFPKHLPPLSVSALLADGITKRLERNEGIILLQNRRGFAHVVECFECGHVERCDNCDVSLTYHLVKKDLRCHYCGFVKKAPSVCPKCKGTEIRHFSFGTQQVQEELQSMFPRATILRMDRDTTKRKGAHDRILQQFGTGKANILLGTQMVAKGLDFPHVTLVGVISADTQMLLPDFRASEQTFQLLTQVAGRAGRSNLAGEVVIQTLQPDHYSLKHVLLHDFKNFYREELEYRRELDYPPFSRIVLIEFTGGRENEVHHHAKKFTEFLLQQAKNSYRVLGPADAAIPKIKNQFRKHVVVKDLKDTDPSGSILRAGMKNAIERYEASGLAKDRKINMTIDVDPQGMM